MKEGLGLGRDVDRLYLTVTWPDDAQGTSTCSVWRLRNQVVLLLKCLLAIGRLSSDCGLNRAWTLRWTDSNVDMFWNIQGAETLNLMRQRHHGLSRVLKLI